MAVIQSANAALNPDRATWANVYRGQEYFAGYWMDPATGGLPTGQGLVGDLRLLYEASQNELNYLIPYVAIGRSDRQVGLSWQNESWGANAAPAFRPSWADSLNYAYGLNSNRRMTPEELTGFGLILGLTADSPVAVAAINNARLDVVKVWNPPTTAVSGPSGNIVDNTPDVTWVSTAGTSGAYSFRGYHVRIFTQAQYTASGFNPTTSASLYDSGQRQIYGASSFTIPVPLAAGTYRAYVRTAQELPAGSYLQQFYQWGVAWGFSTFTITTAAPPVAPPRIPANVVTKLDDDHRADLTDAHDPTLQAVLYHYDGSASWPLDVVGGRVTIDARNKIRSQLELTVANAELVPEAAAPMTFDNPLHPFGQYVHVARGVHDQLVSLGTFRIDSVSVSRAAAPSLAVDISGSDWSAFLVDARVGQAVTRNNADKVSVTAAAVIAEAGCPARVPTAGTVNTPTNYLTERTAIRADVLEQLAAMESNWWWYADHDGAIYFGPTPATPEHVALLEGVDAIVISKAFTLSRDRVFDVAIAANDDAAVIAGAYDRNPVSPIRRSGVDPANLRNGAGSFSPGGKPYFFASPSLTTLAAAQSAARTTLTRVALPADRIEFETVPMPDVRPGWVVDLERKDGTVESWYVQAVTIPLDPKDRMTVIGSGPPYYVDAVNT